MAAVFDLDAGARVRAARLIDVGLDAVASAISTLPAKDAVAELSRAQRRLAGLEADLLAAHVRADGTTRDAEKLLGDGRMSRRETRRRSRRAKSNASSGGKIGEGLASGDLSEEQADLLAEADEKSDGAASVDEDLFGAISAADPDAGRVIRDEWLAKRQTKDGVETEHRRQRALRRMQSYLSKKHGLGVISLEGDSVAQRRMLEAIRARADEMYRRDGGRDLASGAHPRTRAQREFDAAMELLCGLTVSPDGSTAPVPNDGSAGVARPANQPRIVVGLTVDKLCGRDPAALATQIGLGLIPDSVLADYAGHAEIVAALFDTSGEQLWQARLKRHATGAQRIALIMRDRGCVRCGASHTECEAHHVMPWHAPGKGRTDLDQLALMCGPCHHRLHADRQTLYRDRNGHWQTRPATPDELPPTFGPGSSRQNRTTGSQPGRSRDGGSPGGGSGGGGSGGGGSGGGGSGGGGSGGGGSGGGSRDGGSDGGSRDGGSRSGHDPPRERTP